MGSKMGFEAKCYFCAAGIGGTPDWTELTNVKDVSLSVEASEADVTTRASGGHKVVVGGLKEATIEFEMVWDSEDAGFTAIQSAFNGRTAIGLAVMDGDIATAGSQGLWADCAILKFDRQEKLGEAITASVTAKPTYSADAPEWKTIAAA